MAEPNVRRMIRVTRLLSELGHTDVIDALDELKRLRDAGNEAADVLRQEATILRDCHTLNGEWDGSEPEVEAGYQRFMALAARLTPNA